MLDNDEDIRLAGALLACLRGLRLVWLEAMVLVQHYWHGRPVREVARLAGCHVQEAFRARDRLLVKAAVALGYLPQGDFAPLETPQGPVVA